MPLLPDVGVLALVADDWGRSWQDRHHVLTRLSRYFNVVWCNPAPWWRELLAHNGSRRQDSDDGKPRGPGFTVYRPASYLPEVGRPHFLAQWIRRERLRRARRILLDRGCDKTVLYLWRPYYEDALGLLSHDVSCYHIDDEYTFSDIEKPMSEQETRVISRVDQVFIHSPALMEKKGGLNPNTLFVPNGVDYHAYATPQAEPGDLSPIPHPRIGYVGRIKEQLDVALLVALAQRHPEWSLVLVGPLETFDRQAALIETLRKIPNVYFLGDKPVSALPAYNQHLDVCILCYALNDYTKYIYPLKLHEYLASGSPVVGSPLPSLREFSGIIRLARTLDDWSKVLQDSLSPDARSAAQVDARKNIARQHDWDRLVGVIARNLCGRLGPGYLERFEESSLLQGSAAGVGGDGGNPMELRG